MEPWIIGLIALVAVGLGVIIYGALHDRARNRRRAAEMLAPPPRTIPHFRTDSPAPHYLSDLQARRAPQDAEQTDLTSAQREVITAQLCRSRPPSRSGPAMSRRISPPTDPRAGRSWNPRESSSAPTP